MLALVLEYVAFGLSLVCSWVYGNKTIWGPILGIGTAIAFIAFGLVAGIHAAAAANIIFLFVHGRNLRKHMTDDITIRLRRQKTVLEEITKAWSLDPDTTDRQVEDTFDISAKGLNSCATLCYQRSFSAGWWVCQETGDDLTHTEWLEIKIGLIHSEISEVLEADRRSWPGVPLMDDKLVHRTAIETELADVLIRAFDYAGRYDLDLENNLGARAEEVWYTNTPATLPGHLNLMHGAATNIETTPPLRRVWPIQVLILRVLLLAQHGGFDVAGAYADKIAYNASRPDHKIENRTAAKRGKRY